MASGFVGELQGAVGRRHRRGCRCSRAPRHGRGWCPPQADDGPARADVLQRRLHHRNRHLRHPRRGRSQGRSGGPAVLRPCRDHLRLLGAVLRRAGRDDPGLRVVVLLRLRHARRAGRVGVRLVPHARVRRVRRRSRSRLGAVPSTSSSPPSVWRSLRSSRTRRESGGSGCPTDFDPSTWVGDLPANCAVGVVNIPSFFVVLMCGLLLLRGASESARVNTIMVFIKLGILAFFCVIAFSVFDPSNLTPFMPLGHGRGLRRRVAGLLLLHRVRRGLDRRRGGGQPPT